MDEFDDRLRAHYARTRLSDDRIQDLVAMHAAAARSVPPLRARARRWCRRMAADSRMASGPSWRVVLCVVAMVSASLGVYHSGYQSGERLGSHAELGARTLREVALNHRTRFDPDYLDDSIASLDERMELLPFSLAEPARLGEGLTVQGSRYCSLAGHLAAHVTLRDEQRRPVSLFVTSLQPDVQRLDGLREELAGLDVQLWEEEGLFYALARHD